MTVLCGQTKERFPLLLLFFFVARGFGWSRHLSSPSSPGNVTLQKHLTSRIKVARNVYVVAYFIFIFLAGGGGWKGRKFKFDFHFALFKLITRRMNDYPCQADMGIFKG